MAKQIGGLSQSALLPFLARPQTWLSTD